VELHLHSAICLHDVVRGCIQKFPDWPPRMRTANGTTLATRCSCIAILWVSVVSYTAITLCVASQRVFIVYFIIDSVRKLLDTPLYIHSSSGIRNRGHYFRAIQDHMCLSTRGQCSELTRTTATWRPYTIIRTWTNFLTRKLTDFKSFLNKQSPVIIRQLLRQVSCACESTQQE
jgi:hypothetical protein